MKSWFTKVLGSNLCSHHLSGFSEALPCPMPARDDSHESPRQSCDISHKICNPTSAQPSGGDVNPSSCLLFFSFARAKQTREPASLTGDWPISPDQLEMGQEAGSSLHRQARSTGVGSQSPSKPTVNAEAFGGERASSQCLPATVRTPCPPHLEMWHDPNAKY